MAAIKLTQYKDNLIFSAYREVLAVIFEGELRLSGVPLTPGLNKQLNEKINQIRKTNETNNCFF